MEEDQNIQQETVKIKASELMKKFKHKEDRFNFCRQKGFWLPNEPGFDSTFFVKFLKKEKELIPIGKHTDYQLKYFRGDGALTKQFLIKIVKSKVIYQKYLPDGIKYESLSKDFLFSLIAHLDPTTYGAMYDLYKKKTAQNIYKKWEDYSINLGGDMMQSINDYVPSKNHLKNLKPFRLSKNHNDTGIFDRENRNLENPNDNAEIEMQDNNLNQGQQPNNNQQNINHINIIPIRRGINNEIRENEFDGLNQINDADME